MPTADATEASARSGFDHARAVADAVLYEGYLLYPYRKSSGKNRVRWQFGVLAPRVWIEARGPVADGVAGSAESWWQQTECLVEASDSAPLHIRPRYLQLQAKQVERCGPEGGFEPVERLETAHGTEIGFDEAVARECDAVVTAGELVAGERRIAFGSPAAEHVEPLYDERGDQIGRVVRRRWSVSAVLRVSVESPQTPFRLRRLRLRIENTGSVPPPDAERPEALRHSLIAAHTLVGLDTGSFLSLLDPPAWAAPAAKACANIRTFPVLAGVPGRRDLVLSAPIILYDHPQIAPESPGDLHDSGEIDEILSLRTMTLTDDEKWEARATDPRAAAIVDRVDSMPPEVMERLHGAVRSLRPAASEQDEHAPAAATPWWDPGADASVSPDTDGVVVDGVRVARGSRVRLRPRRRGTDAHDMFLAGRTALVEAVFLDVDDAQHLAVTLEDDPSAEVHQWYGRFYYFSPVEVEPVHDQPGAAP